MYFFNLLGGLDSSVLAVLADRCLDEAEPLDLLNVAFENADGSFDVPDRLTALKAIEGLLKKVWLGTRKSLSFWVVPAS